MQNFTRIILVITVTSFFSSSTFAQIFDKTKGKNVQKLYNQPITVYTHGKGSYSERMETAFNSYWKITPFQMKDASRGLPSLPSGSSVFMPAVVGMTVRDHATSMNHPFFIFGEAGSSGMVSGEGIVAAFPINGFHYEFNVVSDSMYNRSLLRIPYMVHTLNDMLTHLKANGSENDYYKGIEAKSTRIASKTLLIPAELTTEWDVNPNTTALMKANLQAGKKSMKPIMAAILDAGSISYKGKYKIMPTAEILALEQTAEADQYSLFLPAINNKKYLMVFDLKTKELLYYEYTNMGMKIKGKDFDKLNKAAGL